MDFVVGIKIACLVSLSTTTKIASWLLLGGKSVIQSRDTLLQGLEGIVRGFRSPKVACQTTLFLWQASQLRTYASTVVANPDHLKYKATSACVLAKPKCPASGES